MDRRVQRTRKLLSEALMTLILEKGYDAITVQDITDRANLGRATMYLHYKDKEDLLVQSLREGMDELIAIVEQRNLHEPTSEHQSAFVLAFQHAAKNADLYRVLLSGQGAATILTSIRDYISTTIQDVLKEGPAKNGDGLPVEVAGNFISGALLMLMEWWLRTDTPYSAEEMAAMFSTLTIPGMRAAYGENPLGRGGNTAS